MKRKRASITVEAALILPVFLFVVYFFLYFYEILIIQEEIHLKATNLCQELSSKGYLMNLLMEDKERVVNNIDEVDVSRLSGCIIDSYIIEEIFMNDFNKINLLERCIYEGARGISFLGSSLMNEEEYVVVQLSYKIKFPVFQELLPMVDVLQRVQMKSFHGFYVASRFKTQEETTNEVVYITEHGTVYHTNRNCTYLVISCEPISYSKLLSVRNANGSKYHACKLCYNSEEIPSGTVYITKSGTCFHKTTRCSYVYRSIKEIPILEVGKRMECKKCRALQN